MEISPSGVWRGWPCLYSFPAYMPIPVFGRDDSASQMPHSSLGAAGLDGDDDDDDDANPDFASAAAFAASATWWWGSSLSCTSRHTQRSCRPGSSSSSANRAREPPIPLSLKRDGRRCRRHKSVRVLLRPILVLQRAEVWGALLEGNDFLPCGSCASSCPAVDWFGSCDSSGQQRPARLVLACRSLLDRITIVTFRGHSNS